jgi:hypothetical protein
MVVVASLSIGRRSRNHEDDAETSDVMNVKIVRMETQICCDVSYVVMVHLGPTSGEMRCLMAT